MPEQKLNKLVVPLGSTSIHIEVDFERLKITVGDVLIEAKAEYHEDADTYGILQRVKVYKNQAWFLSD